MTPQFSRFSPALVLFGALSGTLATGVAGAAPPNSDAATKAPQKPGAAPISALKAADLEALRATLRKAVTDQIVPGVSLVVMQRGQVLFREGFGNMGVESVAAIASSTKPITATTTMMLAERGKIALDEPFSTYLPEFKGTVVERATVRQLLCHTAGVLGKYPGGRPKSGSLADFSRLIAKSGSLRAPGTFNYSGVGMDIAARVCEVRGGAPFETLVRQMIWEPLGMTHSRFSMGADPNSVAAQDVAAGQGRYVSGGGGMSSTLDDMAAFYQMHLEDGIYGGKRLLSEASATAMHTRNSANARVANVGFEAEFGNDYGLGFYLGRPATDGRAQTISHGGAFGTMPWLDKDREMVAVLFCQTSLNRVKPLAAQVHRQLMAMVPATRPANLVTPQAPPLPLDAALGTPNAGGGAGGMGGAFDRLAGDDDSVSKEDFRAFLAARGGGRMQGQPQILDRLFERLDTDGDGALSRDEWDKMGALRGGVGGGAGGANRARRP